jgi:tetrahydromethanopterin S-methyltransferase subunit G
VRDPVITSIAARYTDVDATRLAGRNAFTRAFERSPASDLVRSEVERATERVEKKVDAQLKDVNNEIDKRLSPKALSQAKAFKELKQRLDEVSKRVAALDGR